ncbi:MAG TPA: ATPase, partial [Cyanobacteria bacterium UBA11370]|nr:ATPase [Cyanobacteria bacterium UBA11370]
FSPSSSPPLSLADRHNMAYMGTTITYGRALAVVTETGMNTELGQIATAIQSIDREATPLQQRLDQLGGVLAIAILVFVIVIFCLGLLRGEPVKLMFLMAVSLAVAAIPEGLPAVVTIALALGASRMLKQHALIRKLPAVETLGSVTAICSDKTGTLTQNRMTVTCLDVMGHRVDLTEKKEKETTKENNFYPLNNGEEFNLLKQQSSVGLLLTGAALCNDALLEFEPDKSNQFQAIGDPTESALVVAAAGLGLWKTDLENTFERIAEVPFDAERKRMTTIHQLPITNSKIPDKLDWVEKGKLIFGNFSYIAFTKGAVDSLLNVCSQVWINGKIAPLSDFWYKFISHNNDQLAGDGIRVLGVAFRPLEQQFIADLPTHGSAVILEQNLVFVGIIGMIDPPRPEVKNAVLICKKAGIRPVMITGDHPLTARHIASELGISTEGYMLTGQDLDQYSIKELENVVEDVSVYARVSPQHKLEIVQALQNRGHIVAMTGDGVNDAPALKKADIGVAMGVTGTDVAKEAADMVLLDDNFATIVAATQEGRVIYDNVRKFINYTLTGNCGELWVIVLAPFWGMPLPLLPLQILWINLLADGLLALALGVEPAEPNIMIRPPHKPKENIFSRGVGRDIIWIGLLLGIILLSIDYNYWSAEQASWQTMVFSTLAFSRMGLAQSMRSERESIFRMNLLSNKPLLAAVILTFILQLAVVYSPFLQAIFKTTALSLNDLCISLVLSSVVIWAMELDKWWLRHKYSQT